MLRLAFLNSRVLGAAMVLSLARPPAPLVADLGSCPLDSTAPVSIEVEPYTEDGAFPEPLRTAALHVLRRADSDRLDATLAAFPELDESDRLAAALDARADLDADAVLQQLLIPADERDLAMELATLAGEDGSDFDAWKRFVGRDTEPAVATLTETFALADALHLAYPIVEYDVPASGYGWRVHPWDETKKSFHGGIDFAVPPGTRVYAPREGKLLTGYDSYGGNWAIIDHGHGVSTLYCHLKRHIETKGFLSPGQLFARSGNSGVSTGPHLHYSVRIDGKSVDPRTLDPYPNKPTN